VDELPKLTDVLVELAHDEVGSVPREILLLRGIRRWKKSFVRRIGIEKRSVGHLAVLIAITEDELT
jgi:hypothetical protein